jgi:uncharacterized membrane protein
LTRFDLDIGGGLATGVYPAMAVPVALVAAVIGPLVGAHASHLKNIASPLVGVASVLGAGTFDGMVLSGIVAAYLV